LYRSGELSFVAPPSPEQEGLSDLVRCADDLRCARTAARHRVAKQLLRHGRIFREGKNSWTKQHMAWVRRQRLDDPNAQRALEHMLAHLDGVDAQLGVLEHELAEIATREPYSDRCAGCAACAASRSRRRWGCWPRSAIFAASHQRAS
jgi:transposase